MGLENGRLLVVDDNEMNRDMLSRRLVRKGHTVEVAEGGLQALEMIEESDFDVVLLDIMMPSIDGYETLERIRSDRDSGDLPVIMATAKDQSEDIVAALKLGANDYVTKPFDFPVVLARVQTQLQLKRSREALATAHGRMKKDLDAAARIQASLLPSSEVVEVEGGTITAVSGFDGHQGVALVVEPRQWATLDEVLALDPDVVIVYSGNNEFVEDRSYAAGGLHGLAGHGRLPAQLRLSLRPHVVVPVRAERDHQRGALDGCHAELAVRPQLLPAVRGQPRGWPLAGPLPHIFGRLPGQRRSKRRIQSAENLRGRQPEPALDKVVVGEQPRPAMASNIVPEAEFENHRHQQPAGANYPCLLRRADRPEVVERKDHASGQEYACYGR